MSSMIYRLSLYLSLMHISTGFADQFDKYSYKTIDMNVGKNYDFLSIMHYDRRAFTKNGKETIVRIDNQAQEFGMPDLKSLSPMDILELNALYDCKSMSLLFLPIFVDCKSVKRPMWPGFICGLSLASRFFFCLFVCLFFVVVILQFSSLLKTRPERQKENHIRINNTKKSWRCNLKESFYC